MSNIFATPWTLQTQQALLPMGFSGKNTGMGYLFFFSPSDLPNPGIESASTTWQPSSLPLSHLGSPA